VRCADPLQLLDEIRALEVVQRDRIDGPRVRRRRGPLIHPQHEPRAGGALEAVSAEPTQVLLLGRIVGVMPVPDVNQLDLLGCRRVDPFDQLRERPADGSPPSRRAASL